MLGDDGPGVRQLRGEHQDASVLGLVALLAPDGVVEVLLASGVIGADGLQMAVRARTDPHLGPGRRDRQRLDAGHVARPQSSTCFVEVGEAGAASPP